MLGRAMAAGPVPPARSMGNLRYRSNHCPAPWASDLTLPTDNIRRELVDRAGFHSRSPLPQPLGKPPGFVVRFLRPPHGPARAELCRCPSVAV